jgi:hypothetical protein
VSLWAYAPERCAQLLRPPPSPLAHGRAAIAPMFFKKLTSSNDGGIDPMDEMIDIVQSLKNDVAQLRRIMALNVKVGDSYPGESQIQRLESIIDELERVIRQSGNAPRP